MTRTPSQKQSINRFVKEYKRGVELTNSGTKVNVGSWNYDYVDREGLRQWFMSGLNRKINSHGNIRQEYRNYSIDLYRDCQIYTAWKQKGQKTQWGFGFRSLYFKKRFPEIQLEMKEVEIEFKEHFGYYS
jgi:hypothetical protein